jgi:hypothetical protein
MLVLWRLSGISPFSRSTVKTFVLLLLVLFPLAFALSSVVELSIVTLPLFAIGAGLVAVALVAVTGCLQAEDEIPLTLIEDRLGIRIPVIHRYIPSHGE